MPVYHNSKALGQAMEDYAKAIYKLEVSSSGQPVTTDALAKHLRVTAASASAMAKKLAAHGLVTRVPYHGVRLTAQGTRVALEVVRHHRLLELFLVRELGMSWDRVHDEADVLEHVISEEIEARIAAKLGDPRWDPHGDPIPTATGDIDEAPTQPVTAVEVGSSCRLSRVSDEDPEVLRYLTERGISIGDRFTIVDRHRFDGPTFVRFDGEVEVHALGGRLAAAMRAEVDS
jgi:DtxR family Mn-dependent transcriptional regulator